MRLASQLLGLSFIALGVYAAVQAEEMTLFTEIGPGSGFFPFWLGILLAVLSAIWLVQITFRPFETDGEPFLPDKAGAARILAILGALFLFTFLAEILGFQLTMLAFLFFLLLVLGRRGLPVTLVISVLGSFGVYFVFKHYLDVQLPASSIEVLRNIGL